ncbi:MAG: hypothetical protein V3U96_02100 [Paracoccaceae bacterium]
MNKSARRPILRLVFLIWVALIAFGLPEIIAGTGRLWLSNPGTYVLSIPLYSVHFLLLCHVAIKTGRTSWPALFLFGVLFGLYEAWITKVVWSGYPGSDGFSFGGFGQWFGIHETLGLVLFYHAVISFLLPLAVVSRLFSAFGQHFPVPNWVFGTTWAALLRRVGLLFILGIITGHNNPDLVEYLQTWVPYLGVIWLGYVVLRRQGVTIGSGPDAVARATLSRVGFAVAVILLMAIYAVPYFKLQPEMLPPVSVQLVTLAFYPVLAFLLWRAGPAGQAVQVSQDIKDPAKMPLYWLLAVFVMGLLGIFSRSAGIGIPDGIIAIAFVAMVPLGLGLFLWLVGWKVLLRR